MNADEVFRRQKLRVTPQQKQKTQSHIHTNLRTF